MTSADFKPLSLGSPDSIAATLVKAAAYFSTHLVNRHKHVEVRMMTYKEWILLTKEEENGVAIDYTDPEGNQYSEPFCFYSIDEALNYGRICVDQLIKLKRKPLTKVYS